MIYAYIRVSTDKQTLENQEFEIKNYALANNLHIDKWVKETISGAKDFEDRKLGMLLKNLKNNDILITAEMSRLGRSMLQIMTILHRCMKKNIEVWTIKDRFRLGKDIQSQVLAFAFGLSAEIERQLISQRTKEALARIKAEGRKLGRQLGSKNKVHKLDGKHLIVTEMLKRGVSKTKIAKAMNVSRVTIYNFLAENNLF